MGVRLYDDLVDAAHAGVMRRLAHAHEGDDADPGSSDVKRRKKKSRPEEFHKVGGQILATPCGTSGRLASCVDSRAMQHADRAMLVWAGPCSMCSSATTG